METMEAFPGVRKGAKTARLMVAILPMASLATAGTIRIYDGVTLPGESSPYEGTGSLWISSANPDWYQGGLNALIRVGYQSSGANVLRGLIRFGAINEIYSGVDLGFTADQITGARLIVTTDDDGFGGSGVCELRVLGDSDEEWAEYHTTWNVRRKDTNPVQNWADGYGTGVGTNFGPVMDTVSWVSGGPRSTAMAFDLTGVALDVVKNWVSGADTTDSFVLKAAVESGSGDVYFDLFSEDNTKGGPFPVLEIDYLSHSGTVMAVR